MQPGTTKVQDPARCRSHFEDKLAFTTGTVELERMIRARRGDFTVVDVRAAEDFAKGHIPGAISLPERSWDNPDGLARDRTNVVYCYSLVCHLGAKACAAVAARGYPVMELDEGFASWKEQELEIEHEPTNRLKQGSGR